MTITLPAEGIGTAGRRHRTNKGRQESGVGEEIDRLGNFAGDAEQFWQIHILTSFPHIRMPFSSPSLGAILKGAETFPIDPDYAGANHRRIVDSWVAEVLNR